MKTSLRCSIVAALATTVAVSGCGKSRDRVSAADSAAASREVHGDTAGGMANMPGMSGTTGMTGMMSAGMMDSMDVHMRMMDTMTGAQMKAMMPAHRQMVANMLAQMNSEMRGMKMTPEARWTALIDSVRQDLVRMPELTPQQCKAMMPAHHDRITLLMRLHRGMMEGKTK